MIKKYVLFAVALSLTPALNAGDCSRGTQRGCNQPSSCSKPNDRGLEGEPRGSFVTGPSRGEVSGESNSLGLRLGTLRIPEVSLALPTVQLPSVVRFRRDASMHVDSGEAPFVRGEVADFGLRPRGITPDPNENPRNLDAEPSECPPACDEFCPQQCVPQTPCGEGCVSKGKPGADADPWQNSQNRELALKEQQVARLESQVTELHKMVEQLVNQQSEEATQESTATPSPRPKSKPVNPWSQQEEMRAAKVDTDDATQQSEQIAALQAKIEELSAAQQSRLAKSSIEAEEREIAEPLIRKSKTSQTERPKTDKVSSPETASTRRSVFGKLGMALSRR